MWSECSAGDVLASDPLALRHGPRARRQMCLTSSRLSCSVTACYPPRTLSPARVARSNSAFTTSRPVAAPPPRSSPAISALRGHSLTGPGSSLRANDWHHQQAIHSTPSRGWWAYCLVVDSKVTAGESSKKEGRCTSAVVNNGATCLTYWLNTKGREQVQNIDSYKVYVPQGRSSLSPLAQRFVFSGFYVFASAWRPSDIINTGNDIQLHIKKRCLLGM